MREICVPPFHSQNCSPKNPKDLNIRLVEQKQTEIINLQNLFYCCRLVGKQSFVQLQCCKKIGNDLVFLKENGSDNPNEH